MSDAPVLTVGVDLAAEAKRTAVAFVAWDAGEATVTSVRCGVGDDAILDAMAKADKVGIDSPLGWPDEFVAFILSHQHGPVTVPPGYPANGWKRRLTLRLTDHVVKAETGLTPLSVSADLIGHVALRCACLLAEAGQRGHVIDRAGGGVVTEVYPAASLRAWGLTHGGYKQRGTGRALGDLVDSLMHEAPWLHFGTAETTCRESHDAFDAVIAALTARAAARGLTRRPQTDPEGAAASSEGWVAFPRPATTLANLILSTGSGWGFRPRRYADSAGDAPGLGLGDAERDVAALGRPLRASTEAVAVAVVVAVPAPLRPAEAFSGTVTDALAPAACVPVAGTVTR